MYRRIVDIILVLTIMTIPSLGILQACGGDGPTVPHSPSNQPPKDNHPPVAVLKVVSGLEGPTPLTAKLDASDSSDPDGDDLEFLWLFSDGTNETGATVEHVFKQSGRQNVRLMVTDEWGLVDDEGPVDFLCYGLANSAWPKFAHDERNSGLSPNLGPMMDLEHSSEGLGFPRFWRTAPGNGNVNAVCVSYDGVVIYTQGPSLKAYTAEGLDLWTVEFASEITTWPAIAWDGSIVLGTVDGWVHRVSSDGEILWSLDLSGLTGRTVRLETGVNVDGRPRIYLCGDLLDYSGSVTGAIIFAVSMDGVLQWSRILAEYSEEAPRNDCVMSPAILPNGNIVVNTRRGAIYTPEGDLVRELEYTMDWFEPSDPLLGPPSVSPDGLIMFSHARGPVFTQEGSFVFEAFGESANLSFHENYTTGYIQVPVWGVDGMSLAFYKVDSTTNWPSGYYVFTRSDYGGMAWVRLTGGSGPTDISSYHIAGAAEDRLGRLYVSCLGLRAISPISSASVYPIATRRYSIWAYRPATVHMSAPVIGDDGWLYVGYGSDILAIGD